MTVRQDDMNRLDRHAGTREVHAFSDEACTLSERTGTRGYTGTGTETHKPTPPRSGGRSVYPPHATTPLCTLLAQLKQAGCTVTCTPTGVYPHPANIGPDRQAVLDRHHHALTVAAAGTHPDWWTAVRRGGDGTSLVATDLPWSGDGFACTTCGTPADHLDHYLLPWCNDHLDPEAA